MCGNTSELRKAMLKDDVERVKQILEESGDGAADLINEDYTSDCLYNRQRNIQTPLHTAVGQDRLLIAEVFHQYGADPHSTTKFGLTGLHLAAKRNNVDMCKLQLRYGADLYARDIHGKYAVHTAAMSRVTATSGEHAAALEYLITQVGKPEDANLQDDDGNTPLHDAAFYGNLPTAEYLVRCGADTEVQNKAGRTALDVATYRDKYDVAEMLRKHVTKASTQS